MPIWLQWVFTILSLLAGTLPLLVLDRPERPMSVRGRALSTAFQLVLGVIGLLYLLIGGA